MGDVQGSSVHGVNYPRRKMSRCNYLGAIFLGGDCPEGNCPGGNCQGDNCLGGNHPVDNYPRWELSGVNCPETIV